MENRLPLVYLVDSAGVFLPLQDEVFPDEDDFGRIFRNNAVISAAGMPQFAAIMGNCVAGGGYLPVLCDKLLMTEGSGLYLAGPALVKAAIGQTVSHEELGGAAMHAADQRHHRLPREGRPTRAWSGCGGWSTRCPPDPDTSRHLSRRRPRHRTASRFTGRRRVRRPRPAAGILDDGPFDEYKAEYGQTLVCGYGRLGGVAVGVVANQRKRCKPAQGPMQYGGVIYVDRADKAARFVMDCNQTRMPILFLQDVNGFMVGRDSEQAGIIRAGAKLVNAISNSVVPKLTVIIGGSFGAGNYALCGKAFDPRFIFAWPTARYAVMGGDQAANTLLDMQVTALKRAGNEPDAAELAELRRQGEGELRRADGHPLRRGPAVGGRDRPAGGDAGGAADGPGGGDPARRRPPVHDGRVAGVIPVTRRNVLAPSCRRSRFRRPRPVSSAAITAAALARPDGSGSASTCPRSARSRCGSRRSARPVADERRPHRTSTARASRSDESVSR